MASLRGADHFDGSAYIDTTPQRAAAPFHDEHIMAAYASVQELNAARRCQMRHATHPVPRLKAPSTTVRDTAQTRRRG